MKDKYILNVDPRPDCLSLIFNPYEGLGLASAKALCDYGFGVIAGCYGDNSDGAKELKGRPWVKKIEVVSLDVTSVTSVSACVKEVEDICRDQGV